MMGMCMRGLRLTSPIRRQSASPLYICARVRPWMVSALIPQSCNCSASSVMISCSLSQPNLVLTVTGILTASTTRRVISSISGTFCNKPAPAPFPATRFTGQPKLRSNISGCDVSSTIFAASAIASGKRPYICMATGRSASLTANLSKERRTLRTRASEATNSE